MAPWYYNPHVGGQTIPPAVQERTKTRILNYAKKNFPAQASRLRIRFQKQFCYLDMEETNSKTLTHLCRLRYFREESGWSLAFYTYSNERYQPCLFPSGQWEGQPEKALEIAAVYFS